MKKQIHAYYSGTVQGVGFRYMSQDIARGLGVLGYVKNLRDGRVEILAEAEEKVLTEFLASISSHFSSYIQDADISWQPATGEFREFHVQ